MSKLTIIALTCVVSMFIIMNLWPWPQYRYTPVITGILAIIAIYCDVKRYRGVE